MVRRNEAILNGFLSIFLLEREVHVEIGRQFGAPNKDFSNHSVLTVSLEPGRGIRFAALAAVVL